MVKPFAVKGETVVCENGHPIMDAARDLYKGVEQDAPNDWTNWRQPEPPRGAKAADIKCTVCGAPWFSNPSRFHFKGGYRP